MYGADYAWILHETFGPPWWQQTISSECHQRELEQAVENLIIVSSHNSIVGSSISGLVGITLSQLWTQLINQSTPIDTLRLDKRDVRGRIGLDAHSQTDVTLRTPDIRRSLGHGASAEGGRGTVAERLNHVQIGPI